jgi:hypothetical protein
MTWFVMLALFASLPLGGLLWVRWRFKPGRMQANADRLLREAEAKMEAMSDDELVRFFREHAYLNGPVKGSKPARRVAQLIDARQFALLANEWPDLWPSFVEAERLPKGKRPALLDHTLELGAAATVLARRHP